MRTPTLQYLYLQRPLVLLLLIAVISVLFWIGSGEFYTKGEPREASVALSMVENNDWILPQVYADELAYKPPLTHWLMSVFSLPRGEVTPFTSRLPSALAFIGLIGVTFLFFGKRLKSQEAFLACLILLTSFELHRAAMTARVDMLLTFLIVLGLASLYNWEEKKKLSGFPLVIPLILGLAALVKGIVGIALPLLVFGIYLLFVGYNFWKVVGKLFLMGLCSLILPGIWYFLAYRIGGESFINIVTAESIGRFLGSDEANINYNLGHEEPVWYNLITLLAGFIPWTILLLFSVFTIKFTKKIPGLKTIWQNILSMPKIKLFSLVAAVVIVIFYSIPMSKRSVYLMPAYPFIAIFLSQYILYLTEYRVTINRIFSTLIGVLGVIVSIICLLTVVTHFVDPIQLSESFIKSKRTLADITAMWGSLNRPNILYIAILCTLIVSLYILFKHLLKKNNLKVLYATIGVYMTMNLVADGIFLPAFKDGTSMKPFAEELKTDYRTYEHPIYVMNNLLEYSNMYGLNFYLGNNFRNFEKEMPESGFFLAGSGSFQKVVDKYGDRYHFTLLKETVNKNRDGERTIQFYSFEQYK